MATYVTITDSQLDPDAPITSQLAYQWRDNPIAIAQADTTVALSLLPTVLLGTLTTTSGSTQTLSGLVLTPYRFLRFTVDGVSFTTTSGLYIASVAVGRQIGATLTTVTDSWSGSIILDLSNGIATSILASGAPQYYAASSGYSAATTSISFTGGTFDAGSIRVYGEK